MYILLVAATPNEISAVDELLRLNKGHLGGNEVDVLVTGVGSVATTYALTRQISSRTPELVLQAGIGGTFSDLYAPPAVVLVGEEVFADLGAFSGDGFDDIFDLGLAAADEKPFTSRMLVNPHLTLLHRFALPVVRGATINSISATNLQLSAIVNKYAPDVESMEGAAAHFTCLMEDIPFIQMRAISNFAGERDKRRWMLKEAIAALNEQLKNVLQNI